MNTNRPRASPNLTTPVFLWPWAVLRWEAATAAGGSVAAILELVVLWGWWWCGGSGYYVEVASWPRQKRGCKKEAAFTRSYIQLCEATTAFLLGVPSRSLNLGRKRLQRKASRRTSSRGLFPNDRVRRGPPADPRNLNHNRKWRRQSPLYQKSSASSSTCSEAVWVKIVPA